MLTRSMMLLVVATLTFAVRPAVAQDPERAGESSQEIQELREIVKKLRDEQRLLREKVEELTSELERRKGGDAKKEPTDPRREDPFQSEPFRRQFRDLHRGWSFPRLRQFGFHPFGTSPLPGRGESFSLHRNADGSVRVEVRTQDENGKDSVQTYEAESMEALRRKHPEIARRFGGFELRMSPDRLPGVPSMPRPFDGFPMSPPESERLGVLVAPAAPEKSGLAVQRVEPDSLARRLGIEDGDVILEVNGVRIERVEDVRRGLQKAGEEVEVTVSRDGKEKTLTADAQRPRKSPRRLRRR